MTRDKSEPAIEARDRLPRRAQPSDFFAGVTLVGALLTALGGALAESVFLAATFMAMLLLRRFELPRTFEFAFGTGIVLQGWGNALWLFQRIGWYDKAVHFLTPLLVVPSLYLLLAGLGALPSASSNDLRRATLGVFVVTTAIGIALAAIWEIVEGTADRLLSTSLAHGYLETIDDLYSSLLGSVAAGAMLAWLVSTGRGDLGAEHVASEALTTREYV